MTPDSIESYLAIGALTGLLMGLWCGFFLGLITKAKADDDVPDDSHWLKRHD